MMGASFRSRAVGRARRADRRLLVTRFSALAFVLLSLSGCVERAANPPRSTEPIGPIYRGHAVAQTLDVHDATLIGIDVRLATYARRNGGTVTLHVKRGGASSADLRTASVEAGEIE